MVVLYYIHHVESALCVLPGRNQIDSNSHNWRFLLQTGGEPSTWFPPERLAHTASVLQTGGEPSTWFPPERLVHLAYSLLFSFVFLLSSFSDFLNALERSSQLKCLIFFNNINFFRKCRFFSKPMRIENFLNLSLFKHLYHFWASFW